MNASNELPFRSPRARPRLAALWPLVEAHYTELDVRGREMVGVHMPDHVLRVAANCATIVRDERAPFAADAWDGLIAAAYVHDLGYSVVQDDTHAMRCLEVATPMLRMAGYSDSELADVSTIVTTHHDKNHTEKSLSQRILYVADKCDGLGFDGVLRMFMEWGHDEHDRDVIADKYLTKIGAKVRDDLLPVGVGSRLIKARWEEASTMLLEVVRRRHAALDHSLSH